MHLHRNFLRHILIHHSCRQNSLQRHSQNQANNLATYYNEWAPSNSPLDGPKESLRTPCCSAARPSKGMMFDSDQTIFSWPALRLNPLAGMSRQQPPLQMQRRHS
jgi:hypothetical protein